MMDTFWSDVGIQNDPRPWNKRTIEDYYGPRCSWMDNQLKNKYCPHVKSHGTWVEDHADRDFILRSIGTLTDKGDVRKSIFTTSYEAETVRQKILPKEPRIYPGHQPEFDLPLGKRLLADKRSVTCRDYAHPELQSCPGGAPQFRTKDAAVQWPEITCDACDMPRNGTLPETSTDRVPLSYTGFDTTRKKKIRIDMRSVTHSDFTDPASKTIGGADVSGSRGVASTPVQPSQQQPPERVPFYQKALTSTLRRYHKQIFNTEWIDKDGRQRTDGNNTRDDGYFYCGAPYALNLRSNFLSTMKSDYTQPHLFPGPYYVDSELHRRGGHCFA